MATPRTLLALDRALPRILAASCSAFLVAGCALHAGPIGADTPRSPAAHATSAALVTDSPLPPVAVAGLAAAVCRETWPTPCELPDLPVLRLESHGFEILVLRGPAGRALRPYDAGLEHDRRKDGELEPLHGWRPVVDAGRSQAKRPADRHPGLLIRVVVEPRAVGSRVSIETGKGVTTARTRRTLIRNLELAATLEAAETARGAGDAADAERLAQQALRTDRTPWNRQPDPAGIRAALHRLLASIAADRGDSDTVQEQLALACAAAPRDTAAWAELAGIRSRLARPEEAARAVRRVQRDGRDRSLAWLTIARWNRARSFPERDEDPEHATAEATRWLRAGAVDEARSWDVRARARGGDALLPATGLAADRRGVEFLRHAALVRELERLDDAPADAVSIERAIDHARESGQPDVALRLLSRHWSTLRRTMPSRAAALREELTRTVGASRSQRICSLESRSFGPNEAGTARPRPDRGSAASLLTEVEDADLGSGASGVQLAAPIR